MEFHKIDNKSVDGPFAKRGFIDIPLASLRESFTSAITNIAANGGILASDTTPILDTVNGDTDSALRVEWVANEVGPIMFQATLPPDFDTNDPLEIHLMGNMSGTTPWDSVAWASDTFFNVGDTKVEDTATLTGALIMQQCAITVAAADIPADARTVSIELTPGAHANDAVYIHAIWLEYTRL